MMWLAFGGALVAFLKFGYIPLTEPVVEWWVLNKWNYGKFIHEAFYFMSGSILFLYKDKIPCNKYLFTVALSGLFLLYFLDKGKLGLFLFLPYIIIYLCVGKKMAKVETLGDYSYGVYIFSFPIQQTLLVAIEPEQWNIITYTIVSILISFVFALFSWKYIEKPALSIKSEFIAKPAMSKGANAANL